MQTLRILHLPGNDITKLEAHLGCLGFTWTLQCSSFFGLVCFFVSDSYLDYQKGTTLEGLGRGQSLGFRD